MNRVTSVKFDKKTGELLDQLKVKYGCPSKSEVLRKGIALLSLHAAAYNENAKMMIKTKDGQYKEIIV